MNTHSPNNTKAFRAVLKDQLTQTHGLRGDIIPREKFLHGSWDGITLFAQHQRHFPLIRDEAKKHRDFCARAYTLLTIQYGAYGQEPDIVSILKDFIDLLGEDSSDQEAKICEYAAQVKFPFFPGLIEAWQGIQEVYKDKLYDKDALPRTSYLAYALLTLNRKDLIGKKISADEMFGALAKLNGQMSEIHGIVRDSQHPDTGVTAEVLEFKRPSS